jgi:flagellar hook protein FlgE
LEINMDFTGSSQYFGGSGVNSVSQNGFQSGSLVGLSIGDDGVISGRYSNGVNQPLQQLVLVTFRNPQSMVPVGKASGWRRWMPARKPSTSRARAWLAWFRPVRWRIPTPI